VILRPGTADDDRFVATLARCAFGDYGDYDRVLPRWLGARGVATVIAEERGTPVGFAMVGMRPGLHLRRPDAELLAVAVAAGARGRGVGTALVREAITIAERWRARDLCLHTAEANMTAQHVFARAGFLPNGIADAFYANGQGALAMRRPVHALRRRRLKAS
jgi:ribosomal protein S18 acetylase RimI-like enzyme